MRYILLVLIITIAIVEVSGQKLFTRSGKVVFSSDAPLEKIEAHNSKAISVLDLGSGQVEWSLLIKAFQFKKALMQDHFNENYLESSKYPKAKFIGVVKGIKDINFKKDGEYHARVVGDIEIHGVQKSVETDVVFKIDNGKILATSFFELTVSDFQIKVPNIVRNNISKVVEVNLEAAYKELPNNH